MISNKLLRRKFIKNLTATGVVVAFSGNPIPLLASYNPKSTKRIGIIGLDTSHSIEFTKLLNGTVENPAYLGYKVVVAYPKGSNDIESALSRIPGYTEEIKKSGVEICNSIGELLDKSDMVLLETNDGRLHLEQAAQVIKAGKPMFIDKPIAASLKDAITIYAMAAQYKVPVFSSSALRFTEGVQNVRNGKIGKITGADTFSPAYIEKTHPDFFWYGIHGIEILFTVMGTGCNSVTCIHTDDTDVVIGKWSDGRLGTFRGLRTGAMDFGGIAYGEKEICTLGKFDGYESLLREIIKFFESGKPPVPKEETLEIVAFMEAAQKSKSLNGASVSLESIIQK